ncbi:MAG: hypothetical protein WKF47_18905 [Geodermatophilaceae bacterium]
MAAGSGCRVHVRTLGTADALPAAEAQGMSADALPAAEAQGAATTGRAACALPGRGRRGCESNRGGARRRRGGDQPPGAGPPLRRAEPPTCGSRASALRAWSEFCMQRGADLVVALPGILRAERGVRAAGPGVPPRTHRLHRR